ncbi:DnaJ likeubfamily C member 9 [Schistosoma japonicum]|nr:DnaJ likeubfamily C member 9 [Schistosoma japonicum]
MSNLLKDCNKYFHTKNLYEVLRVTKKCHKTELRKAFYKLSLLHHPDRHDSESKSEATKRFQILSRVYSYMENEEKRKIYDETGAIDEDDEITNKSYNDWVEYWQLLFPKVTTAQIDEFCKKYKDSEQETKDLIKIYNRSKGDMDIIMETLILTSYQDEARVRNLIEKLIASGKIDAFKNYTHERPEKAAKRAKRALEEEKLFAKEQKKKSKKQKDGVDTEGGLDSLAKSIQARHENALKSSENFLDKIAQKYCSKQKTTARKRPANKPATSKRKK